MNEEEKVIFVIVTISVLIALVGIYIGSLGFHVGQILKWMCNTQKKDYRAFGKYMQVEMINPELAVQSARNYRMLRKKGITVRKTIYSLIATYCIENGNELLHTDSDFDG